MAQENQRVVITKRMLREGLLRLLETKELDKINITELCKEAGINRITFYRHYETPRDVLREMENDLLDELKHSMRIPKSLPEFKVYLEEVCDFLDSHIDLLKIMIQNNTDSEFLFLLNDFFQEIHKDRGLTGVLGEADPEVLQILSIYNAGGGYFLMRQWLLGNIEKTPKEIANIFYNQLCNTDWVGISKQLGLV